MDANILDITFERILRNFQARLLIAWNRGPRKQKRWDCGRRIPQEEASKGTNPSISARNIDSSGNVITISRGGIDQQTPQVLSASDENSKYLFKIIPLNL